MRRSRLPVLDDVVAAERRLLGYLTPTPLVPSPALGPAAWLKLETVQPTGSFKVRGALAALTALAAGERVVTASAGNHALGVAWAASLLGIDATVVCAETASPAKLDALCRLPVELVLHGKIYDEAERHALELAAEGRRYVSAYNDPDVVAGGGSLGLELLQEIDGPFTAVCPVGGGGLVSGIALACSRRAGVRVVGVEAEASRGLSSSVAAGRVVDVDVRPTLADGLAGNLEPGSITIELAARHVAEIVAVSEEEIAGAMRFLHARHGVVAEGAGAVAVAAVQAGRVSISGAAVCVVSGANVAEHVLARVLETS
jgi:threonine dehydratase